MGHFAATSGKPLDKQALAEKISRLAPDAPAVIMVHGYRYCPDIDLANPHALILGDCATTAKSQVISWPRKLRFTERSGLTIGFGWSARGSIWEAYARADTAAENLSKLIATIGALDPDRKIHIIAHSLGARVALLALSHCTPGEIARMILLSPAVFRHEARRIMSRPGASKTEVFSVICTDNSPFDLMLRAVMPHQGPTLGRGGPEAENWLDLQLSKPRTEEELANLGLRLRPTRGRVSHWSCYLRPGVWRLYRTLLVRPEQTPLAHMRRRLCEPPPARAIMRKQLMPSRAGYRL